MAMDASSVETSDINDDDIDGDDDGDDAPNIEDNDDENINDEYGVVRSSSLGGGNVLGCDDDIHDAHSAATYFEAVVNARYACTRFRRHREEARTRIDVDFDDNAVSGGEDDIAISSSSATRASTTSTSSSTTPPAASISDPAIVDVAYRCLSLSTRAPTGFNAQPYRMILVHSRHDKENVARYCLGRNADRVRDSDCTAVFLADAECGRDWHSRYANFLLGGNANDATTAGGGTTDGNDDVPSRRTGGRTLSKRALLKLRLLILLFSSGYPLPRCVSMPISFCVRCGVSFLGYLARLYHHISRGGRSTNDVVKWLLPTLYPSDTWSQKNTMLVAMTYMLACTSHGLATCPMEGYDAIGIKAALGVPMGRYTVPLIVCAGRPYHRRGNDAAEDETDDAGLGHGGKDMSPRYPMEEVVYRNGFGEKLR
jgi:nitroreductase